MSSQLTCSRYAGGNIKPARFVKQDTSHQGKVLQATDGTASAGDKTFGISDKGSWQPPLNLVGGSVGLDDGYIGIVGSPPITVFMEGAECYVLSGAAFSIDADLKADSDGRAITASTTGDNIGAIALEASPAANTLVKVRVKSRTLAA